MKRGVTPTSDQVLNRRGFTIVELLIVIVVIGILAAITIVAYNGVTQRARVASLSTDLEGATKQLAIDQVTDGAYPVVPAAGYTVATLRASAGTTYQYAVNNSANPQTFCITATNGTTSYYASSTNNVPTVGACAGQGSGGVAAITNLNPNPSAETDGSLWGGFSNAGSTTLSVATSGGFAGQNFMRLTVNAGANGGGGIYAYNVPATAGTVYTSAAYARMSSTKNLFLGLEWHSQSSGLGVSYGSGVSVGSSGWTRLSWTGTAPVNTTSVTLIMYATTGYFAGGSGLNAGDVLDIDAAMTTVGSTLYNYADGSSSNWIWNGTPNTSSSTGPPL